jgi:hypothetical protein
MGNLPIYAEGLTAAGHPDRSQDISRHPTVTSALSAAVRVRQPAAYPGQPGKLDNNKADTEEWHRGHSKQVSNNGNINSHIQEKILVTLLLNIIEGTVLAKII